MSFRGFSKICVVLCAAALAVSLMGCTKSVKIGDQKIKEDSTELSLVVSAEDVQKFDLLPALRSADLRGSECYEEIYSWAQTHPTVNVRFSLTFPDGTTADDNVEMLTLNALNSGDVEKTAELIGYMSGLEYLSLDGSELSLSDISTLAEKFPDVSISYSFDLLGKDTDYHTESLSLVGLTSADVDEVVEIIPQLPELKKIDLGSESTSSLTWEDISRIQKACPDVNISYSFTLYNKPCTVNDTELDLNHIPIADNGALVYEVLSCMPKLRTLDMDSCGVDNEHMAGIRDAYPDVNVIWRIWFGENYSVRTDVERILASNPTAGGNLTPANTGSLRYCTKVKYMDIGHNEILKDISFVQYMPELEVLVAAMDGLSDISPISACTKLEYLEIQTNTELSDISPLASLVDLRHLNIARCGNITDLTPLYGLTKLERLWLGASSKYPAEQVEHLRETMPDCEINTYVFDPTEGGWRFTGANPDPNVYGDVYLHPRYEKLREQFGDYDYSAYSFSWNDPMCY